MRHKIIVVGPAYDGAEKEQRDELITCLGQGWEILSAVGYGSGGGKYGSAHGGVQYILKKA